MGAWESVADAFGTFMLALLVIVLGWAAIERGRVHHRLARLRRDSGQDAHRLSSGHAESRLVRLFRFVRRARRIHLIVGAVAGYT